MDERTSLFRRCVTEDRFQFEEFFQPSLPTILCRCPTV